MAGGSPSPMTARPDPPCQFPKRSLRIVNEVEGVDRDERISDALSSRVSVIEPWRRARRSAEDAARNVRCAAWSIVSDSSMPPHAQPRRPGPQQRQAQAAAEADIGDTVAGGI